MKKFVDTRGGCGQGSGMSTPTNPIPENKPGSREFEETMNVFETTVLNKTIFQREAREFWKHGAYYCCGQQNQLFQGFLAGMAFSRNLVNLSI